MSSPPDLTEFRFLGPLGRGGTAEVVRVFSKKQRRQLALKYPLQKDSQSSVTFAQLAHREDQLIGGLKFPGLVRILEISTNQPQYLLMELCTGPTLDRCGKYDNLKLALNILSSIALNLEFLRANSIIHGDLKPQNIFLPSEWQHLYDDRLFYTKLSDFSLGRFNFEPEETRVGLGTVGYMAPETVTESRTTFQSDLFALGVIAYQLLAGVHPFMEQDNDPVKINSRIREDNPAPLLPKRPDLPERLVALVDSLLAKDEADRPQTGWEVCEELRKIGARFPFERAMRPAHFFASRGQSAKRVWSIIQLSKNQQKRLRELQDEDDGCLRLLLTANFIKSNLRYDGDHFTFTSGIYWPAILRCKTLGIFQQATFAYKRLVVKAAIVGDVKNLLDLGIAKCNQAYNLPQTLLELIRHFVRPRLLRNYSMEYAPIAERAEMHELAAQLYLQAGKLREAERCAYQAAVKLNKDHNSEGAIRIINKVVDYAELVGRVSEVRQLLMTKGDIHKQNGDTDLALVTYQQIINLSRGLPSDKLLAETYKDLGDLHTMRQEFEAGVEALNNALVIYQDLHDDLEISHTLNNIGNIYWVASDLDASLDYYRRALRIQRWLKATPDVASTLSNIAMVYVVRSRFGRAIHIMHLSLGLKREIGDAGEIARTLNNLGYAYRFSGDHPKAVSCLTESLEVNRRIGSKKEILFNLENLTEVMITVGRLKESLSYLKEGIMLSRALGDKPQYGAFNLSMGTVLKRSGRFTDAERHFATVDTIVKEINDRMLSILTAIQRASLRYSLGDNVQAQEGALQALHTAEEINNKSGQLNALLLIMKVSLDSRYVEYALSLADELHLSREKTLINFNIIESYMEQGKVTEAQVVSEMALPELDRMSEDIELPWMCNIAAELMIINKDYESALSYLSRSQRLANDSGLLPEMITILTLQGRINLSKGDYEQCYSNYKNALQICKAIAADIISEADRQLYQNKRSTTFLVNEIKRLGELMVQKQKAE